MVHRAKFCSWIFALTDYVIYFWITASCFKRKFCTWEREQHSKWKWDCKWRRRSWYNHLQQAVPGEAPQEDKRGILWFSLFLSVHGHYIFFNTEWCLRNLEMFVVWEPFSFLFFHCRSRNLSIKMWSVRDLRLHETDLWIAQYLRSSVSDTDTHLKLICRTIKHLVMHAVVRKTLVCFPCRLFCNWLICQVLQFYFMGFKY
jgi:hypothetical protein